MDTAARWPKFLSDAFTTTRYSGVWLLVRVWLGFLWLDAGWHKLMGKGWLWFDGGASLEGFWTRAVAIPAKGRPAIRYDWYRDFLAYMLDNGWHEWFGTLIVFAEILVGLALILGALTGLAAFGGWFMNVNFMLAGTAATNQVMATMAAMLMISYAVAGHAGLDRWLLPRLGTPWGAAQKIPLIDRLEGFAVQLFYIVLPLGFGVLAGQELIASDFVNHFIPLKALGGITGGALGLAVGGYVVYRIHRAPAGEKASPAAPGPRERLPRAA